MEEYSETRKRINEEWGWQPQTVLPVHEATHIPLRSQTTTAQNDPSTKTKETQGLEKCFDSVSFESECVKFNGCIKKYQQEATEEGLPVDAYVAQLCGYCLEKKSKDN